MDPSSCASSSQGGFLPRSLHDDYPLLKTRLVRLANLTRDYERLNERNAEVESRLHNAPPGRVPFIKKLVKNHYFFVKIFKKRIHNLKIQLGREMKELKDSNDLMGVLSKDALDVRCIAMLRKYGGYTKGVIYSPQNPNIKAICSEASTYGLPTHELKGDPFTQDQLEDIQKREKERSTEEQHAARSVGHYMERKDW